MMTVLDPVASALLKSKSMQPYIGAPAQMRGNTPCMRDSTWDSSVRNQFFMGLL